MESPQNYDDQQSRAISQRKSLQASQNPAPVEKNKTTKSKSNHCYDQKWSYFIIAAILCVIGIMIYLQIIQMEKLKQNSNNIKKEIKQELKTFKAQEKIKQQDKEIKQKLESLKQENDKIKKQKEQKQKTREQQNKKIKEKFEHLKIDIEKAKNQSQEEYKTLKQQNEKIEQKVESIKLQSDQIKNSSLEVHKTFQEIKQEIQEIKEKFAIQKSKMEQQKLSLQYLKRRKLELSLDGYKYDLSNLYYPNQIVQVEYDSGEVSKMPLNPLQKNKEGKKIEDIIYPDEATRKKRIQFEQKRKRFINFKRNLTKQILLIEFNNPIDEETQKRGTQENQKQWLRLEAKFSLSKITKELPICIISPGYNNNANFRIQHTLNSIFMQNYSNYKVVIIDDASTDGSLQIYKKYLDFYKIDKKYYTLISNTKKATAMPNHFFGTLLQCSKDSIVLNLDGDDELIGRNVLKLFNQAYQTKKSGVVYSNFITYYQPDVMDLGFTIPYKESEKKQNKFRETDQKFSHLRSFRAQLLHQIDPKQFLINNGTFITTACDIALMIPLMEVSCGRVDKIEGQYHYLYNVGTGINDYRQIDKQFASADYVRKQKKKYECWKEFDEKMKK